MSPLPSGSEVLPLVVMNISIFRDATPCSPSKINGRFGGRCRVHLQDRRIRQARNQRESGGLAYFSTPSVDFQWTTQRYIPEQTTRDQSCSQVLVSCILRVRVRLYFDCKEIDIDVLVDLHVFRLL
jgi:hypothetical protein